MAAAAAPPADAQTPSSSVLSPQADGAAAGAGGVAGNAGRNAAWGAGELARGAAPAVAVARDWATTAAQRIRRTLGGAADALAAAYPGRDDATDERREDEAGGAAASLGADARGGVGGRAAASAAVQEGAGAGAKAGVGWRWVEWAGLAALTFAALAVRLPNLEFVPPGFQNDEAELAFGALTFARGEGWPGAWTFAALGSPAGPLYPQALLFRLLEPTVAVARTPSALFGAATVPAAYFLMRQLFSARASFLAAAFVAFHVWFIAYSRIAFPAMPSAFCFIAGVGLLLAGVRTSRWQVAALGGAVFAGGLYVYQSFIPYAVGMWAILAAAMLVRKDLRRKEVYWFFGASLVVGAHFINLFFFTLEGRVSQAQGFYDSTPLSPIPVLRRIGELLSYAQSPTPFEAVAGTGGMPLLNPLTALFFWLGLAALLLFIRRGSAQLLLLGWLVAALPAILAPDAEARRYLAGVFFLLAIAAVGLDAVAGMLHALWKRRTQILPIPILAGWAGGALLTAVLAAFLWLYAAQHERKFDDWLIASEWALTREHVAAARFARTLSAEHELRLYLGRLTADNSSVRWFLEDRNRVEGSREFGGSGEADADSVTGPTAWILIGPYVYEVGPQIVAAFPQARFHEEYDERGNLLYAAYVVDGL